jgi:hypothetical protein
LFILVPIYFIIYRDRPTETITLTLVLRQLA